MGGRLNWVVATEDATITTLTPSAPWRYDLVNTTVSQRLRYGERDYGINLVWESLDRSGLNVRFERPSGSGADVNYGEPIAIKIRREGFLRYGERDYGINLTWSDSPSFEWSFRKADIHAGGPVMVGDLVSLFNARANDFLFYDPRRWGINLKWLRDEGKFNEVPWYAEVGDYVGGFLSQLGGLVKELVARLTGVVDLVLSLLGLMLPSRLYLRVVILRDADGHALVGGEHLSETGRDKQLQDLDDAITLAKEIFKEETNTKILAWDGQMVVTLDFPAPSSALTVSCGAGAWPQDFRKRAGSYFRQHSAGPDFNPVTVFVVSDVNGNEKIGCCLGPLTDYILISKAGLWPRPKATEPRPSTLAHELGHACGLWFHHKQQANLMYKSIADERNKLNRWQKAWFRSSPHVKTIGGWSS